MRDVIWHWDLVRPPDRDAVVLVMTKYVRRPMTTKYDCHVLTDDGWQEFAEYEVMPTNLPTFSGVDMQVDFHKTLNKMREILEVEYPHHVTIEEREEVASVLESTDNPTD